MAPDGLRRSPKDDSCPSAICGVWVQRMAQCESLCPLLEGLGLPKALLYAAKKRLQQSLTLRVGEEADADGTTGGSYRCVPPSAVRNALSATPLLDDASLAVGCGLQDRVDGHFSVRARRLRLC